MYKQENVLASGIPLGGLGTGSVELRADGRFHDWEIFNNYQWSGDREHMPPEVWSEDAFFAVRAKQEGGAPKVRLLYNDDKKARAMGNSLQYTPIYIFPFLRNINSLTYSSRYPFADLRYEDPALPLNISLRSFTPFIPFNGKDSGLPLAFFEFTVKNPAAKKCEASIMFGMRNFITYDAQSWQYHHTISRTGKGSVISMEMENADPQSPSAGTMAIAAFDKNATYILGWSDDRGLAGFENAHTPGFGQVFQSLRDTGSLYETAKEWRRSDARKQSKDPWITTGGAQEKIHRWRSAICTKVVLKPHEEKTIRFAMSWFFPNHYHYDHREVRLGHMYENWFSDAAGVMNYGMDNYKRLYDESRSFCDNFYKGLDPWLAASFNAQLTTLPQAFWWTKNGEFCTWEGSACCQVIPNANTIWSSFQPLLFFPDIYLTMKKQMGAVDFSRLDDIREKLPFLYARHKPRVQVEMQKRDQFGGWFSRRYRDAGYTEEDFRLDKRNSAVQLRRPSGNWSGPAMLLRDYLWSGDKELLEMAWVSVRDRLHDSMAIDDDDDGLLDGAISYMTYDHWFVPGLNCYRETLWLCDLACGAELARIMNDTEAEKEFTAMLEKGKKNFHARLWNGEYYDLCVDKKKDINDPGCMAEQVSGNLYARLCGIEPPHQSADAKAALKAVYKYNRRPEEGLLNGADPKGRTDWTYFARFSQRGDDEKWGGQWVTPWTGTEYYVSATMIAEGLVNEGLQIAKDVYDRHIDFGLLYNHIECGEHYFRPMVIWAILPALQGLVCDRAKGEMTFSPNFRQADLDMPFILPGVWGRLEQRRSGGKQVNRITAGEGKLELANIGFVLPKSPKAGSLNVKVSAKGKPLTCSTSVSGSAVKITFRKKVVLTKGKDLLFEIKFK